MIAEVIALLHDIGKVLDREVEGSHAAIGADLVKQWDKSPEVAQGIAEHHGEAGTTSIWGFIVAAADAISSARPGARRESLEHYLKRLKALEDIGDSFKGVEKSYAIQAGREVRILVKPEDIDDLGSMRLARDIVKKIEESMEYPGQTMSSLHGQGNLAIKSIKWHPHLDQISDAVRGFIYQDMYCPFITQTISSSYGILKV